MVNVTQQTKKYQYILFWYTKNIQVITRNTQDNKVYFNMT